MFALDFLRVLLAHLMLLRIEMPLVSPPAVGGKFHIPPDLVVDQRASDGESSSNHVFLFLHDVWAMFCRYIGEKIASTISMVWHFTTKSSGI